MLQGFGGCLVIVLKAGAGSREEAAAGEDSTELMVLLQPEARAEGFQGLYGQMQGRSEPERCFLLKIGLQGDVPVVPEGVCLSWSQ